ncbi:phage replisome organizer N-terminal domain-containing protein [Virgibacillus sp. M23]|uniref:phage replisome organizer N-terminal domain-containing protein n=1 Tax=Virgibacillus sp. M23 TaxID=3079030 RepID=UPI002A9169FD|nr:phage replisome organizer N-terminal domain-containing protein [Virgibacillus sp. M23]MDY7044403.1 phage replisome organizer N-terminal domain-containing protein [Virgibacillus sp. M23]
MSDVKWIKLSTNMFEDEKIRLIEQMPEADTILIIWVKLLSQAGKTNASGYIYLNENIPYTDEMLATIFNRPIGTVRLALETFKSFGMIEIDENSFISISNWEKHQNIAGMERVKKLNAERNRRYRERKKQQKLEHQNNDDVSVTSRDGTEEDREEELERDIDKEREKEQQQEKEVAAISQFWDDNGFGFNNMQGKKQLLSWLDDSSFKNPSVMILKALEIACSVNKRRLNYVEGILRNWQNESLLTVEEVEQRDKSRNNKQPVLAGYDPNKDRF